MARTSKSPIKQRGKNWYCNFTDRHTGTPMRAALGTTDKDVALQRVLEWQQWCEDRATNIKLGRPISAKPGERLELPKDITVDRVFELYYDGMASKLPFGKTVKSTRGNYALVLGRQFLVSDLSLKTLRDDFVKKRLEGRGRRGLLKASTVNNDLLRLNMALKWALEEGLIEELPKVNWSAVKLRLPDREQPILQGTEEERLLLALDADLRQVFEFAVMTSLRKTNCLMLRKDQITWTPTGDAPFGKITVKQKSKLPGGKIHVVPLDPDVRELLETACAQTRAEFPRVFSWRCEVERHVTQGKRQKQLVYGERYEWGSSIFYDRWYAACKRAGVDKPFHALTRGTAITRMIEEVGVAEASKTCGHASIQTTMIYANIGNARKLETLLAVRKRYGRKKPGRDIAQMRHTDDPDTRKVS